MTQLNASLSVIYTRDILECTYTAQEGERRVVSHRNQLRKGKVRGFGLRISIISLDYSSIVIHLILKLGTLD